MTKFLKTKERKISRHSHQMLKQLPTLSMKVHQFKIFLWMLATLHRVKGQGMAIYDRTGTSKFSSCKMEHILNQIVCWPKL